MAQFIARPFRREGSVYKILWIEAYSGLGNKSYQKASRRAFDGDIEQIFKWCMENPTIAPARLAELVPVFAPVEEGKNASWHPYAKRLIDEFGEYEQVLDAINANINTFPGVVP